MASEPTPELNKALSELQADLPEVEKSATGKVEGTSQSGKDYSFEYGYAKLSSITKELMPRLSKVGLSYAAISIIRDDGRQAVICSLRHASGEQLDSEFILPERLTVQKTGSAVSYFRRYGVCMLTGVAPVDEDDDGHAASQVKQSRPQQRPQKPRAQDNGHNAEEPEDTPGSALPRQLKAIHTQLTNLGIKDRERGLATIEAIINGPLRGPKRAQDGTERTSSNLSYLEAEDIKRDLAARLKAAEAVS